MATSQMMQTAPTLGENISDLNNNGASSAAVRVGKNYEKYSLRPRSIQNRIETEKRRKEPKKQPKPKTRAPPLSKYRRKTANARERGRMQDINGAFEALQRAVPQYPILPVNAQGKTCEKLTKITTLKLAMNYIQSLSRLLDPNAAVSSGSGSLSEVASTSSNSLADMDDFCSSGSSEFSPASSYTLSPLACSPPDCMQTVMRSFVLPTNISVSRNTNNLINSTTALGNNNNVILYNNSNNNNNPTEFFNSNPNHRLLLPQTTVLPPISSITAPLQHVQLQLTVPAKEIHVNCNYRLPPTTIKYSTNLLSQSVSSLLAECSQGAGSGGGARAGSLSSLTESDLSEYASDLLSDEGSTLDDPMFEDIIGVGVGMGMGTDDLDLLLESDGDSLQFSSDLTDN